MGSPKIGVMAQRVIESPALAGVFSNFIALLFAMVVNYKQWCHYLTDSP